MRLAERIFAPHYAAPMPRAVVANAPLTASRNGEEIGRVSIGETFEVLEITAAHAWGVAQPSGRVGYLFLAALAGA